MKSEWGTAIYIIVSWVIVAFGQPAWIPWLSPLAASVGFAIFWHAALKISFSKKRFLLATLWFIAVQLVQLSWMTSTEFQGNMTFFVYGGLALFLGLQFGAMTLFVDKIPLVATASLWTLIEAARLHFMLCGFSWNPVGLSLTTYFLSLQAASLCGILGLSFLVFLTNLAFLRKRWAVGWALALLPYGFGMLHASYHFPKIKNSPTIKVGIVQTGLLPSEKMAIKNRLQEFIFPYEQWKRILSLIKSCQESLDLLVLPECSVPLTQSYSYEGVSQVFKETLGSSIAPLSETISNLFWIRSLGKLLKSDVIVGLEEERKGHFFNSAFFYSHREGEVTGRYDKQVLVPIGEYIPFEWMRPLAVSFGISSFFTPGKESKVFTSKIPLAISICYEETFSHLMRRNRLQGASLLVNLTNDGWYPHSRLPAQHFDHARARAVENGVPMIRSCNTGITSALDSLGRVMGTISGERTAAVLTVDLPIHNYFTLYRLWGDWGIVLLSLFFISTCLCLQWRRAPYPL